MRIKFNKITQILADMDRNQLIVLYHELAEALDFADALSPSNYEATERFEYHLKTRLSKQHLQHPSKYPALGEPGEWANILLDLDEDVDDDESYTWPEQYQQIRN